MRPENIGKLEAREAAILMGVNAARGLIESCRKDRGDMRMDAAAEATAAAMGSLIDEAAALGYSSDSLAIMESFAMTLGEELYPPAAWGCTASDAHQG